MSLARRRHETGSPEYSLRVCLYNSNKAILDEVRKRFGGIPSKTDSRNPRWKASYSLIWTNAAAARLLEQISPFLRVKAPHAAALLAFHGHLCGHQRDRDSRGRLLPLSVEELAFRRHAHRHLRRLNTRGVRKVSEEPQVETGPRSLKPPSVRYHAGFIDGEGTLLFHREVDPSTGRQSFRLRISVANTDRAVLEDIQRTFDGILVRCSRPKAHWKPAYRVVWTNAVASRVLRRVAHHLRVKREQGQILLAFAEHSAATAPPRSGRFFASFPDEVLAYREGLYRQVRELNARGLRPAKPTLYRSHR